MPSFAERMSAPMRPDGHHRFAVIGSDHDDVRRNGACVLFWLV